MSIIALFGAAGKMGARIAAKLKKVPGYRVLHVEAGQAGLARLRAQGVEPAAPEQAAQQADAVVLAVPDVLIGRVSAQVVPLLKPGAMLICLDPAAPLAGELPPRADVSYFVVHPCHPPIINDETMPEARADFFGGIARQNLVCALMQGPEADYARGEALARAMFAPVMRVHRLTVEQIALLEPAMSETTTLTLLFAVREGMEEAIRHGVPVPAARDFMLGHLNAIVNILFGPSGVDVSDGAKLAVRRAQPLLLQPDWKQVFEPENVREQVRAIVEGSKRGT
ncbi:MAG: semialdehyde dehydrogenase [Anaerolineae bacterium]|nr:semialdehyde dehydrogenase [Anaerolineae bacterium]